MLNRSTTKWRRFGFASVLSCFVYFLGAEAHAAEYTNFFGMKFVTIPSGTFKMGAPAPELEVVNHELPQRSVEVPSFQVMTTELTLAQFKRYVVESSRVDIVSDEFMTANSHGNQAPVVFVSRNDVRNFLFWLNQHKPANDAGTYRLPTEAEWEYACRARTGDRYCGSNTPASVAWYASNTVTFQQPVAQKKPNAFGLYDMSGNAREWVEDCYHSSYENAPTDARAWTKSCISFSNYVARGGSWNEGPEKSRVTERMSVMGTSQSPMIGFRVVRSLP